MGHEGFYNSLLAAMGNVVSAILMYALQAAWLCQRLIDQDYRQNHGSRLTPILDSKNMAESIEIVSPNFATAKNSNHKMKSPTSKTKKIEMSKYQIESSRSHRSKHRRYCRRDRARTNSSNSRLNSSHPYLEGSDPLITTFEYVNGLGQNLGLRRAFSDINISSNCSEFNGKLFDSNQNYLSKRNINETGVSVTEQDFLKLIFTNGYVT